MQSEVPQVSKTAVNSIIASCFHYFPKRKIKLALGVYVYSRFCRLFYPQKGALSREIIMI